MADVGERAAPAAAAADTESTIETTASAAGPLPVVLARPEHTVSRTNISGNALKVLYRLHHAGYLAYLVGGGVRDLLLGRTPKDFDVGTNARPREIRRLFRNSRIIGRRFRLVHVFFKGETVEVSTFRASPDAPDDLDEWAGEEETGSRLDEEDEEGDGESCEAGEEYGTPVEDSHRRDLTVNALFYNIADFTVIDHVGGLADLDAQIIRTIGPPVTRFEEDPVRMMRALEYAIRLSFTIEPATDRAIHSCAELITEASAARLTYELLETLASGHAAGICDAWRHYGILDRAFPEAARTDRRFIALLQELDRRLGKGQSFSPAALLGTMFLPGFADVYRELEQADGKLDNVELLTRLRQLLEEPSARMRISNHTVHLMHNGMFAISKLRRPPERGRQVVKLARQDCFRVMWDLYSLGVATGVLSKDAYDPWANAFAQLKNLGPGEEPKVVLERTARRRRQRPRQRRRP